MKKKTVLERFKEIEDLEVADEQGKTVKDILPYFCENVETALIKAEKEHSALDIIKEKNVDVNYLRYNTFHDYNCHILTRDELDTKNQLTQEEFELLRSALE